MNTVLVTVALLASCLRTSRCRPHPAASIPPGILPEFFTLYLEPTPEILPGLKTVTGGASYRLRLLLGGLLRLFLKIGNDLTDTDAEIVIEYKDFTAGDQSLVDVDIHGIAGELV